MVARWGMSHEVGPLAALPVDGRRPAAPGVAEVCEETSGSVDEEVRRIVDDSTTGARDAAASRGRLDALAEALLERESLDEADAYAAAGVDRVSAPPHHEELTAAARVDTSS